VAVETRRHPWLVRSEPYGSHAVTAIQKGISLPALQRLLGHDRLTTTEIYLNLSPEEVVREFREKW
jgi:site-specific recombinase XerD